MSKNINNRSKAFSKLAFITCGLAIVLTLFFVTPAQAAEYYPKDKNNSDKVEIKSTRENVYASGNEVTLKESIAKDIVVAGSKIQISANVGRSIIAAGEDITINSDRVAGNVRVAGKNINIRGNFGEEVVIAGRDVTIENSIIGGDLVIASENLTIKNSQILGNAKISYSKLDGDLKSQVKGKIEENKDEGSKGFGSTIFGAGLVGFLVVQFSVIVFLLVVGYLLFRKKALENSEIKFDRKFGTDILISLGVLFLTLPILILSFIIQLYPLVSLLSVIAYMLFILTSFFLPIYVANFAKNIFKINNIKIQHLIAISYLTITILSLIPVINIISFLVFFVLLLGNFGFLVRKLTVTVWNSLDTVYEKNLEIESEEKNVESKEKTEKKK